MIFRIKESEENWIQAVQGHQLYDDLGKNVGKAFKDQCVKYHNYIILQ